MKTVIMPEKEIPDNREAGGKQDEDPTRESVTHDVSDDRKIGPVLREKREEMGLGLADVYEITRIRPNFLEALEEEDWAKLPSPTLVIGFIRAYADALGLDDKDLVSSYRKAVAPYGGSPKPLVESRRFGGRLLVLAVCILLAGGGAAYFWKTSESKKNDRFVTTPLDKEEKSVDEEETAEPRKTVSEPTEPMAIERPSPEEDSLPLTGREEYQGSAPREPEPSDEPGMSAGSAEAPEFPVLRDGEESEEVFKPLSTETSGRQSALQGEADRTQTLGMLVKSRTWVRVIVDGQEPKEYIFEPGTRRQWEGDEGFDVVVGNAGGVELYYNGEKLSGLGNAGQVVRLNLPRDLERIGRGR